MTRLMLGRRSPVTLLILVSFVGAACVDTPASPAAGDDAIMTTTRNLGGSIAALNAVQKERLQNYKAEMRWVGDAHHEAMTVVIEELRKAKREKRSLRSRSAAHCRVLEKAAVATLRAIDGYHMELRTDSERTEVARGFPELMGCTPLSIFAGALSSPSASSVQETEPEVTGAYEPYVESMELAITVSNGSVAAVQAAVDPIVAQAILDGIPEADILALAAMGNLAVSSAVEWNSFDWALLGGGERCDSITCNMMSVFRQDNWDDRVLKVVVADATGCLSGVKKWAALRALLLTPAVKAVAGYCGVRGAIGSAAAILLMS